MIFRLDNCRQQRGGVGRIAIIIIVVRKKFISSRIFSNFGFPRTVKQFIFVSIKKKLSRNRINTVQLESKHLQTTAVEELVNLPLCVCMWGVYERYAHQIDLRDYPAHALLTFTPLPIFLMDLKGQCHDFYPHNFVGKLTHLGP